MCVIVFCQKENQMFAVETSLEWLHQMHVRQETWIINYLTKLGQNRVLSLSHKLSSKMSPVWNYLGICPCFETRFLENRVSNVKLDFWKIKFQM